VLRVHGFSLGQKICIVVDVVEDIVKHIVTVSNCDGARFGFRRCGLRLVVRSSHAVRKSSSCSCKWRWQDDACGTLRRSWLPEVTSSGCGGSSSSSNSSSGGGGSGGGGGRSTRVCVVKVVGVVCPEVVLHGKRR
jgi:uncharacterized membrane protein YgcG